jgi:hypothetical protein
VFAPVAVITTDLFKQITDELITADTVGVVFTVIVMAALAVQLEGLVAVKV